MGVPQQRSPHALTRCVLATVPIHSQHLLGDLRMPDGMGLNAHMSVACGLLVPGGSCTQAQLELCARCMAELVLQMVQRVEDVRACWLPGLRCCCAWTENSLKRA